MFILVGQNGVLMAKGGRVPETNIIKLKPSKFGLNSFSAKSLSLSLEMIIYSVLKTKKVQEELELTNIWQEDMRSKKENRRLCREMPVLYSIIESC